MVGIEFTDCRELQEGSGPLVGVGCFSNPEVGSPDSGLEKRSLVVGPVWEIQLS